MNAFVEAVSPSETSPESLPIVTQRRSLRRADPLTRKSLVAGGRGLFSDGLRLKSGVAGSRNPQIVCLHAEGWGFEDIYVTFADVDCTDTDFEVMVRGLQMEISRQTGSSVSLGIACSKVTAAIASRVAQPWGVCRVARGTEQAFLTAVPTEKLRGMLPIEAQALAQRGVSTLGQLRRIPKPVLKSVFGEVAGQELWDLARGRDAKKAGWSKLNFRTRRTASAGWPGWVSRSLSEVRKGLATIDRALERILIVPSEEVPRRTTPAP